MSPSRKTTEEEPAMSKPAGEVKDGEACTVTAGTHAGKSGIVRDIKTSKTGAVTITVVQADGERFKTLAKNVTRQGGKPG
jgi:ribosomal protein S4E